MNQYQNWEVLIDGQKMAWLKLNQKDSTLNTLSSSVVAELESIVESLNQDLPKGIVFCSGKTSGFIAGANVHEFENLANADEAKVALQRVHQLFDRIEAWKIPSVAWIDGVCLGGGLELSLACHYRVAVDDEKTKLGFPEINLGIYPGWGGSVRLPRLIGALKALPLILGATTLSAKKAKRLGIVDAVVPDRHALAAVQFYLQHAPKPAQMGFWSRCLEWPLMRDLLAKQMRKQVSKRVRKAHYPAPFAAIESWRTVGSLSSRAMTQEIDSVSELFATSTCHNLLRVFSLQELLKKQGKPRDCTIKHVHVVGAGTMGGDIAAWCALQGFTVTLQDQTADRLCGAMQRARQLFLKKLHDPRVAQMAADRLEPDVYGFGIAKADLIIEAIFENLDVKKNLFAELQKKAKETAIFATNTSSIPLDEIAPALADPTRLVGIHFFNPVSKMQLVEVISGAQTSTAAYTQALNFVATIKRLPLPVKSSPGFLVNRVLMPYLLAAIHLLAEGQTVEAIDAGALAFGMPMGPLMLADTVGLDVCLAVAENLALSQSVEIPEALETMVAKKEWGAKTHAGFYRYDKKGRALVKRSVALPQTAVVLRLIQPMIEAAQACLQEGVVATADLVDAGLIFGTGFAPFRGGPLFYAAHLGEQKTE